MTIRRQTKWLHEGKYAARVEVELIVEEDQSGTPLGWSPYLSKDDAEKLDEVRRALREEDIPRASRHAKVFALHSIPG